MAEDIQVVVDLAVKQAVANLKELQNQTSQTSNSFTKFQAGIVTASSALQLLGGPALNVASIFGELKDVLGAAVDEAIQQEKAINELNTALKSVGINSKLVSEDLQAYASQLQQTTTFSDDATISAEAMYIQMTRQTVGVKEATLAAANLAAQLGTDLNSAMTMIIRAGENGGTALRRYGIEIERGANDSETLANAVSKINEQLNGVASSKITTFAGAVSQASNSFKDFLKVVGEAIIKNPLIIDQINRFKEAFQYLSKAFEGPSAKVAGKDQAYLAQSIKKTSDEIEVLKQKIFESQMANSWSNALDIKDSDREKMKSQLRELEDYLKAAQERMTIITEEKTKARSEVSRKYMTDDQLLAAAHHQFLIDDTNRSNQAMDLSNNSLFEALKARKGEEAALDILDKAQKLEGQGLHLEAMLALETVYREQKKFIEDQSVLDAQAAHQYEIDSAKNLFAQKMAMGKKDLDFNNMTNKERIQAQSDTIGNLAALQNSGNTQMRQVGKAAAIIQIGISTQEGAIKAYAALAGIPLIGPFLGAAAAGLLIAYGAERASMVAGYAQGGIVGGNSFTGDNIPANVNSGEMILTRQQQAMLFDQANSGGGGSSVNVYIAGDNYGDESFIDKVVQGINSGIEQRNLHLKAS